MASDQVIQSEKTPANNTDAAGNAMPLFYKKPLPLDSDRHAAFGLKQHFGLSFTEGVNAVPINLVEMPQICQFYPIAFSPDGNATPVAILGLRDQENLFLGDDGQWLEDTYVPAYIRRYPFIFSEMPGSDQLSLCVDMDDSIVSENGGEAFFDGDGNPSELSKNALEYCKSYHAAAQQTLAFSQALALEGLLIDRQAEVTIYDNRKINFSGFKIVDEEKLADMSGDTLERWHKKGYLPGVYAHLFSGSRWQYLTHLLNKKMQSAA